LFDGPAARILAAMGRFVVRIGERELAFEQPTVRAEDLGAPGSAVEIQVVEGRALLRAAAGAARVNGVESEQAELRAGDRVELAGGPEVEIVSIGAGAAADRLCPHCQEPIKAGALKCPHCKTFLVDVPGRGQAGRPEEPLDPRELKTEAHLLALGLWWRIGGVLMALAGPLTAVAFSMGGAPFAKEARELGVAVGVGFLLIGVLGFVLGMGLARFWNWARIVSGLLSLAAAGIGAMGVLLRVAHLGANPQETGKIFGNLLSIVLYACIAYTLLGRSAARVCGPEYRERIEANPDQRASMLHSAYFWIYAIMVAAMFCVIVAVAGMGGALGR
jgi:hypothetical protein